MVTDLNRDSRPDVIGLSGRGSELYWYENPRWERHVLTTGAERMISVAAADLDGDAIPELVLATHFGQTEANSEGRLFRLAHQGDPRQPWRTTEFDRLPTSHRVTFADLDGDGQPELINSPLTGPGAEAPLFECHTPLTYYRPRDWKRRLITDSLDGVVHGIYATTWDHSGREALLTASFGGVWLHRSTGGPGEPLEWRHEQLTPGDPAASPRGGASEIRVGQLVGRRFLATIEPWHGHQVVIYTTDDSAAGGRWNRHVIDDSFDDGHALEVADLNADGSDEVVAGFRGEGGSVYLYYAGTSAGQSWQRLPLDAGGMTAADCAVADLNGDSRPDVVCIGSRTANIKWYENLGSNP